MVEIQGRKPHSQNWGITLRNLIQTQAFVKVLKYHEELLSTAHLLQVLGRESCSCAKWPGSGIYLSTHIYIEIDSIFTSANQIVYLETIPQIPSQPWSSPLSLCWFSLHSSNSTHILQVIIITINNQFHWCRIIVTLPSFYI